MVYDCMKCELRQPGHPASKHRDQHYSLNEIWQASSKTIVGQTVVLFIHQLPSRTQRWWKRESYEQFQIDLNKLLKRISYTVHGAWTLTIDESNFHLVQSNRFTQHQVTWPSFYVRFLEVFPLVLLLAPVFPACCEERLRTEPDASLPAPVDRLFFASLCDSPTTKFGIDGSILDLIWVIFLLEFDVLFGRFITLDIFSLHQFWRHWLNFLPCLVQLNGWW